MAPKRVEDSTGELVEESPQDLEITEVQVPRLVQFPGTADRLAPGLSKADVEFNFWLPARSQPRQTGWGFQLLVSAKRKWNSTFRLAACNPSVLQQRHLDFSSCFTASIALHHWLSKQTDVPVKSSYHDYIREGSTL